MNIFIIILSGVFSSTNSITKEEQQNMLILFLISVLNVFVCFVLCRYWPDELPLSTDPT